jgi:hypothetical protein
MVTGPKPNKLRGKLSHLRHESSRHFKIKREDIRKTKLMSLQHSKNNSIIDFLEVLVVHYAGLSDVHGAFQNVLSGYTVDAPGKLNLGVPLLFLYWQPVLPLTHYMVRPNWPSSGVLPCSERAGERNKWFPIKEQ